MPAIVNRGRCRFPGRWSGSFFIQLIFVDSYYDEFAGISFLFRVGGIVDMPMSQAQEVQEQQPQNLFEEAEDELNGTKDAVGFEPDEKGVYHWIYAMDMKKDKSILYFILKIMGIIMALMYVILVFLIARNHGSIQDAFTLLEIFVPVFLIVVVICYFSYWLTSLGMGGTYYMQYDMEEEGVRFSRTEEQAKMTEGIGKAMALTGALTRNYGLSIASAAGGTNEMYSKFDEVRRITIDRKNHMIGLKHLVMYNMVYADDPYFEGIADYILKRCVNAKIVIKE